jgi:DNA-binding HxlR family transcriptional regulator
MARINVSLRKAGLLAILWFLRTQNEARFGQLVSELHIPKKTVAIRLLELRRASLVVRNVRQEGVDGVGYHVYVLTVDGRRLTDRIGTKSIERLVEAEREFQDAERSIAKQVVG